MRIRAGYMIIGLCIGIWISGMAHRCHPLPSQLDIQRELNRRGHKLKEDGYIGKDSRWAWNYEVFNIYAKER